MPRPVPGRGTPGTAAHRGHGRASRARPRIAGTAAHRGHGRVDSTWSVGGGAVWSVGGGAVPKAEGDRRHRISTVVLRIRA
ncbi:hypothetical protein F4553_006896 [Allocatelliglobosispora scoriae]|uniref:Uncharacterized protein n=1 Tax=Allocatelliglobosispora scoriae TaxID=643052 RepID=A0A841C338_9ACTN|nr:hypothetical protein [Allocatelliglobosispora scoriae]MBB5873462.1 hypothetical protein [Allocatelliglobosispora scoriae]